MIDRIPDLPFQVRDQGGNVYTVKEERTRNPGFAKQKGRDTEFLCERIVDGNFQTCRKEGWVGIDILKNSSELVT